ncbi:MAG TPA: ABC transporter ATP-binding protein [Candidatus Nanopelagicaceae bacterium]|nr:ABC transporter ATP-binding protein [Candidatus Nanopelagicaceae bacterium]
MPNVKIRNLVKKYGDIYALDKINLDINDGELFILLGPSGCGKTTTLFSIAGLIKPEEGEIWFGDHLVTSAERNYIERPQDRNIAMVFQDYAIYPHLTVFKNIAFPLQIINLSREEIKKRVFDTAKSLGIEDLLERKPKQLSGGQRQRVALARAIVREPNVFLMDEPLSNLDAKLRVFARAELKRLHKRLGITIIYVTHDQIEALSMGTTIAILNKGKIEQVGKPDIIYNVPKNLFVAGFIGSPPMNMIDGVLKQENGYTCIDLGFTKYKLSDELEKIKKMNNKKIILGIRPEDVLISKQNASNSIKANIDIIEPMGREFEIHLDLGEKILIAVLRKMDSLNTGDEVYLTFNDKKIHLFDKNTEENIFASNYKD